MTKPVPAPKPSAGDDDTSCGYPISNNRITPWGAPLVVSVIAYSRVSTMEQGKSGLGMECQKRALETYAARKHLNIIESYGDVASGRSKRADRLNQGLRDALRRAKAEGIPLLCYEISRIARLKLAIDAIIKDGIMVWSAKDGQLFDPASVEALATHAEVQGDRISRSTTKALADRRAAGIKLGNPRASEASPLGTAANKRIAEERSKQLEQAIDEIKGWQMPEKELAQRLNQMGVYSSHGRDWTPHNIGTRRTKILERRRQAEEEAARIMAESNPNFGRF